MLATGSPTPEVSFLDASGKEITAKDLLARRPDVPLLLVFFKVTCPVCKLAWPYLERLHKQYGEAVQVVGVSQNDSTAASAFYEENGKATFGVVLDGEPRFRASNAYDVESVPHHVLVGTDGKVSRIFSGWNRKEMDELPRRLVTDREATLVPVVAFDDPVPAFKPG
jgi:peroxiredoxin